VADLLWYGTDNERKDFLNAVDRYCVCEYGMMGVRIATCTGHVMVLDQRVLHHMVFARRLAPQWIREEHASQTDSRDDLDALLKTRPRPSSAPAAGSSRCPLASTLMALPFTEEGGGHA